MSDAYESTVPFANAGSDNSARATAYEATKFRWEPIIYFYCLYIGIIWAGEMAAGVHWTASLGAAFFLIFLYFKYWRSFFNLKPDLVLFCIILCLVLPLIPLVSFDEKIIIKAYQELVKYYALNFVILLGLSLPLTPLPQARRAWLLYIVILAFLVVGWLSAPIQVIAPDIYTATTRVKGFQANGNVFALTAMTLFFLIDEGRSGKLIRCMNHAIVLCLLYLANTSGALVGYAVGMLYRFIFADRRFFIVRLMGIAVGMVLAAVIFASMPPNTFKSVDMAKDKLEVAWDGLSSLLAGRQIDFYGIIEKKGRDVTAGAWRFYYWNLVLNKFWNSSVNEILFGHGIGSMESVFGLKAHNDYLRFLFQTGLFGLALNLLIWGTLYRRLEVKYRWVVVMIAAYCISENNFDSFPTMSMLAFYMIGGRQKPKSEIIVSKKSAQQ